MDTTRTVRVDDPGELAAGLPHLLGYRPRESVVLMALGGRSGRRVGLTVRGDLAPPEHGRALATMLVRRLATDRPRRALAFVVSEAPDEAVPSGTDLPHRALVHDLVLALDAVGIPLEQALLVRGGRWWDFDCPHACCAPGAGTPMPPVIGEIEVASVAAGTVVAEDRSALEQRIAPVTWVAAAGMHQACVRVAAELAGHGIGVTVVDPRWVRPVPVELAGLAAAHRLVVTVEDGVRNGGVGDAVAQLLRDHEVDVPLRDLGVPAQWIGHGTRAEILAEVGLTEADVSARIRGWIAASATSMRR